MAINVNEVYQTVLYILNKEQRGYVTPAEFNKLATQAQLDIFEKYFEDLNQALRMPENDSEYANRVKTIQEKIDIFESSETLGAAKKLSDNVHCLGTLEYPINLPLLQPVELQEMTRHDFNLAKRSKLTAPTSTFPAFTISGDNITTAPPSLDGDEITVYFTKKPKDPIWGYTIGQVGEFLYEDSVYNEATNPNGSRDFEISAIDKPEIIMSILMYAGVIIRDQQIIQAAAGKIAQDNQNEKS